MCHAEEMKGGVIVKGKRRQGHILTGNNEKWIYQYSNLEYQWL